VYPHDETETSMLNYVKSSTIINIIIINHH
jgi:hypothetical protein